MTLCFMSPIIRWFCTISIPKKEKKNIITYTELYRLSYFYFCISIYLCYIVYLCILYYTSIYLYIYMLSINLYIDYLIYISMLAFHLLNKTLGSALAIRSFSQMHKSHFRDPKTCFCYFIAISQLIKSLISLFFNSHIYSWTIQHSFHDIYF